MKITYKFTENELFDFNMFRALRKNSNTVPRAIFISCGYLAVLLIIGYWCKFAWWIYLIFFAAAVLLFFGMIWFTRSRMKRSVRILMFRQKADEIMPQTTLTLEDEFMEVYTVSNTYEVEYEDVERIEVTKQFVYVQQTENRELGIPLRAFDDDFHRTSFLGRLRAKTPKAVHVGMPPVPEAFNGEEFTDSNEEDDS